MAGDGGMVDAGIWIVARASVAISAPGETGVALPLPVGMGLASCAWLASGTVICKSIVSVRSIASVDRTMAVTLLGALVRLWHQIMRWEDSVYGSVESSATARQARTRRARHERDDSCLGCAHGGREAGSDPAPHELDPAHGAIAVLHSGGVAAPSVCGAPSDLTLAPGRRGLRQHACVIALARLG